MNLYLFHTSGCHLCELAEQVLSTLPLSEHLRLVPTDIATSEQWMALYDVRIPVIKLDNASTDLGWPFSREEVVQYLAQNNINL